jgi:hypothetical protein
VQTVDLLRALQEVERRAERASDDTVVATYVDTTALVGALLTTDNGIVYGRRGTGKTHDLKYLAETERQTGNFVVYIDMEQYTGSTEGRYVDQSLSMAERATRLVVDVLSLIHDRSACGRPSWGRRLPRRAVFGSRTQRLPGRSTRSPAGLQHHAAGCYGGWSRGLDTSPRSWQMPLWEVSRVEDACWTACPPRRSPGADAGRPASARASPSAAPGIGLSSLRFADFGSDEELGVVAGRQEHAQVGLAVAYGLTLAGDNWRVTSNRAKPHLSASEVRGRE